MILCNSLLDAMITSVCNLFAHPGLYLSHPIPSLWQPYSCHFPSDLESFLKRVGHFFPAPSNITATTRAGYPVPPPSNITTTRSGYPLPPPSNITADTPTVKLLYLQYSLHLLPGLKMCTEPQRVGVGTWNCLERGWALESVAVSWGPPAPASHPSSGASAYRAQGPG